MRQLFLFPTEAEASTLRRLCPDAPIATIGVGQAEAAASAARLIVEHQPQRVVLCGIAGALDERLPIGQVVEVVSDRVAGLPAAYAKEYRAPVRSELPSAVSFTVNRTGESLGTKTEAVAVEQMEGAAVAAVAEAFGVEWMHIRAISNRVSDSRAQWRIGEALEALARVLVEMMNDKN